MSPTRSTRSTLRSVARRLRAVWMLLLYATNAESPYALGQKVITLADNVLDGKKVAKEETLQGQVVTEADVKKYADYLVGIGDSADVPASLR